MGIAIILIVLAGLGGWSVASLLSYMENRRNAKFYRLIGR